ncbi:MAG: hypothetical protein M1816_000228 [Peltula sp. TS41687]|nr:MAG: hypothetical protein M1816_000228 [Peltula sp. TS41687]
MSDSRTITLACGLQIQPDEQDTTYHIVQCRACSHNGACVRALIARMVHEETEADIRKWLAQKKEHALASGQRTLIDKYAQLEIEGEADIAEAKRIARATIRDERAEFVSQWGMFTREEWLHWRAMLHDQVPGRRRA